MIRRFLPVLTTALLAVAAQPALATEWLDCTSVDFNQRIQLLAGGADGHQFSGATLYVNGKEWSTNPQVQPGDPVGISQAFWDGDTLMVQLIHPASLALIAELRAYTVTENDVDGKGGVLRVPGQGAWVVACFGP